MNVIFARTALRRESCFTKHMHRHTGEKPYDYDICHKRFSRKIKLMDRKEKRKMPESIFLSVLRLFVTLPTKSLC